MTNDSQQVKDKRNSPMEAAIDAYLSLGEHNYAMLVDGDWGVGKTYFIKKYLDERLQAVEQDYVLVSLFGLSSVTEIRAAILRSLGRGGKAAKAGADIFEGAGNLIGGIFAGDPSLGTQYTEKALKRLDTLGSNAIFVFDDLERMTIPQAEALGFINTLVEDQGRPVLLIANQDKIPYPEDWRLRKEKLIGKTISLLPDATSVIDLYLEKGSLSERTRSVLLQFRDQIETSFQRSSYRNLRSLKVALQDFDHIVKSINESIEIDDEHLAEIAQLIVVLTLEVNAGTITADELTYFHRLRVQRLLGKHSNATESDLPEHSRISFEHVDLRFESPALEYRFITDLLNTGAFDQVDMNEWLRANFGSEIDYEPSWRKLGFLQSYEPDEVEGIVEGVRSDLKERKILRPGAILEVVAIAIDLGKNVDLTEGKGVFEYFDEYLKAVEAADGLSLELGIELGEPFTPLDALSDSDKILFDSIARLIEEFVQRQNNSEALRRLEEAIATATTEGALALQFLSDGEPSDIVMNHPVLASIDPVSFAKAILGSVRDFQQGCRILVARYRSTNGSVLLSGESRWLENLRECIEGQITSWPQPTRELQLRFLHNSFVDIRRNREFVN